MEILFTYVPYMFRHQNYFSGGKKFNFPDLYSDRSGLTGSELSCFTYASYLAKRGHNVSILTTVGLNRIEHWDGVRIIPMDKLDDIGVCGGAWDIVYSWNELDTLRFATHPNTLKVVNLQINDVDHGSPGFDDYINLYTSPSHSHREKMSVRTPSPSKWVVVPNGCDSKSYIPNKVDGRVIYASSPDRGLHWLLQIWPKIEKVVPNAHLRIFYEINKWMAGLVDAPPINRDIVVLSHRARYVREALKRLKNHRIEVIGSVSRSEIKKEFEQASILAYPTDTINYTEGFSVTLMEACASGTIPVTTSVDALGEIYGGYVPMVDAPVESNIDAYSDLLIRALSDVSFRNEAREKSLLLAQKYDWEVLTDNLLSIFKEKGKS